MVWSSNALSQFGSLVCSKGCEKPFIVPGDPRGEEIKKLLAMLERCRTMLTHGSKIGRAKLSREVELFLKPESDPEIRI